MKTTIGGDRLGSGSKQKVSLKTYSRSSHDMSQLWRSSMSAGTLVPFLSKLALPGDSWDIDLRCEVLTLPTIGPLFGSYKVQLDVFEVPLRLYNAELHMNKLAVGNDMSAIALPLVKVLTNNHANYVQTFDDNEQVNPSSLFKYLGLSGLGRVLGGTNPAIRRINAVPLLCYWDIFKNYYANKQEDKAWVVHTDDASIEASMTPTAALLLASDDTIKGDMLGVGNGLTITSGDKVQIFYPATASEPDGAEIIVS